MIAYIIVNCLLIWGIYGSTRNGELFNLENLPLPQWMAKPLYDCPFCMSSVWGSIGFWVFMHSVSFRAECLGFDWYFLPIYLFACCGLNYLIVLFLPNE